MIHKKKGHLFIELPLFSCRSTKLVFKRIEPLFNLLEEGDSFTAFPSIVLV